MSATRLRRPCQNCPWRKDAPAGHWHPDHFRDIWKGCQDDGFHIMLCHKATALPAHMEKPVCQGWVRVLGFQAIGVRIAAMTGQITRAEVDDHEGPSLYASFEEMLRANDLTPTARNRYEPPPKRR